MQTKTKSLNRVTLLYCLFFVVIAICALMSFNDIIRTSKKDALRLFSQDKGREVSIIYDIPVSTSDSDFNIGISNDEDGVDRVNARASRLDVEVVSKDSLRYSGLTMALSVIIFLSYLAIFVFLFLMITSLRGSIKRDDNTFSKRVIIMIRAIAVMLIAASLISSLIVYLESASVASMLAGSGYKVASFQLNLQELIAGIMIFVIAEVFSIGNKIGEEHKYTI